MSKKQKLAYILALLLGFISAFSGTTLPIIHQNATVVQAKSVSPVVVQSFNFDELVVEYEFDENGELTSYIVWNWYDYGDYDYFNDSSTKPYVSAIDGQKYLYGYREPINDNDVCILYFAIQDDASDTRSIQFSGVSNVTASSTAVTVTLTSEDFGLSNVNTTVTLPVKSRPFKHTTITMEEGKTYRGSVDFFNEILAYFTPSSSGNYTFTARGAKNIEIAEDDADFYTKYSALRNGFGYKSTEKQKTFNMVSGHTYAFYMFDDDINPSENANSITYSISRESSSNSSNGSNNNSTNNNRTISPNHSWSNGSSSSGGSSGRDSSSFSKGDSRTVGKGSSKADYVRTGTSTVRYDASGVGSNATKATIPATVKIGGTTYRVTTISANAFKGNTKLKTVTIGKNIKTIGKGAFSGCTNLKTLTINSRNLTKKSVKGALSGSSVKTVRVPANKVDSYKNIFTKTNTGSKGKVTVKAKKK